MQNPKEAIKQIQALTYGAYQASGQVAALIGASRPENMAEALEQTAARMEQGTVHLRALCESCLPPVPAVGQKPALSPLDAAGKVEVNEFGWLHIQLNTLLPHCRFAPPLWLTDTISRLLDRHERRHGKLPLLEQALLVIDEYCDVGSRQVYDADNHCILVSSHNLTEIAAITDCLIFIKNGRIVKVLENSYNEQELEALYETIMTSSKEGLE